MLILHRNALLHLDRIEDQTLELSAHVKLELVDRLVLDLFQDLTLEMIHLILELIHLILELIVHMIV